MSVEIRRLLEIVEKHRRQIERSPGVGADAQRYGLAVCDDIRDDLEIAIRELLPPAGSPPVEALVQEWRTRTQGQAMGWNEIPRWIDEVDRCADQLEAALKAAPLVYQARQEEARQEKKRCGAIIEWGDAHCELTEGHDGPHKDFTHGLMREQGFNYQTQPLAAPPMMQELPSAPIERGEKLNPYPPVEQERQEEREAARLLREKHDGECCHRDGRCCCEACLRADRILGTVSIYDDGGPL